MNGKLHREQRRHVTSLFSPKAISHYYPHMVEITARELDAIPLEDIFKLDEFVARISLRLSACNLMSGNVEAADRIGELTEEHLRRTYSRRTIMFPINAPGTPYRHLLNHASVATRFYSKIVDQRIADGAVENDMINRLIRIHLENPRSMPRETVVEQASMMFAASHETVAKAVSWSLLLLSQHPQIFEELGEELNVVLRGDAPRQSDFQQLKLLDAITKESMRLFPPVPIVIRKVRAEATLPSGDCKVRSGDFVMLNHYSTHRDEKVFSNPLQFRPERWLENEYEPYSYAPFSAGPRTCIGMALGSTMINLIVAMFAQRYRCSIVAGSRINRIMRVTLGARYGMPAIAFPCGRRSSATAIVGNVREMVDLSRPEATTVTSRSTIPFPSHRTQLARPRNSRINQSDLRWRKAA